MGCTLYTCAHILTTTLKGSILSAISIRSLILYFSSSICLILVSCKSDLVFPPSQNLQGCFLLHIPSYYGLRPLCSVDDKHFDSMAAYKTSYSGSITW
ncbi:hypothetical protein L1987_64572 [Smallanthus sonchifolius]|uniref:Uncharacterized protein n=1 Tax=Smallanthus sonchifolius TaxID=185202 RepID=A0ACB9BS17_9ASTR|nr:hypothetical protein L1987_64572 [Smallanthus sonchifolius]